MHISLLLELGIIDAFQWKKQKGIIVSSWNDDVPRLC